MRSPNGARSGNLFDVEIVLRKASAEDAVTLAELHRRTALHAFAQIFPQDAPEPTLEDLAVDWERRLQLDDPRQACFVAEQGAAAVGVIAAGADPRDPSRGHLSRLYVAPPYWGRGIGTMLYERAVAHLRAQRFSTATLWVLEGNAHARRWYEHRGWTATDDRVVTYAPAGIEDVGYRLVL
jgi:ribosomal protein S18 acetylase RimI-like enzyme